MRNKLNKVLRTMLRMKRPYGGDGEAAAAGYLASHAPANAKVFIDTAGNVHIDLRTLPQHRTLFVAHVDTMHRKDGVNTYTTDAKTGIIKAQGDVLGADDAAGIAILSVLMGSVPAYYLFCRGEERGGIGSKFVADTFPEMLREMDRAIAFDRRGYSDVITHQAMGRCASDAFGAALSDALNNAGLLYLPCDGGIYTDTAEFVDFIPECTNISCGYDFEHSDREQLDLKYLHSLAAAALTISWDGLPTERDPSVRESFYDNWGGISVVNTGSGALTFPETVSAEDYEIAELVYEALAGEPYPLTKYVANFVGTQVFLLDPDAFDVNVVEAAVDASVDWRDVISWLADEACQAVN